MSVPVRDQKAANERGDTGRSRPIRVVVCGASLFLTAVTTLLRNQASIELVQLPDTDSTARVLQQKPNVLLWQRHIPLENTAGLLQAGLWLFEIDEQYNNITIQHRSQRAKEIRPIRQADDLIAWIIQAGERSSRPYAQE